MNRKNRRALNPAFAAAHGLAVEGRDDGVSAASKSTLQNQETASNKAVASSRHLEHVLKQATATGKLLAANTGLSHPLPDECFHFDFSHQTSGGYTEELLHVVDFSDNNLDAAPMDERVLRYLSVASMRFRHCGLGSMFLDLSSLEHLTILDLSGNKLRKFDLSLMPKSLQELNLSKNNLKNVILGDSATLSTPLHLDGLSTLDLSENEIETLDNLDNLHCPNLRTIRCHHNRNLKAFPTFLQSAANSLKVMECSHCPKFSENKIDLSSFAKLTTVDLSLCKLATIPCISKSVVRLDLSSNKIPSISGLFVEDEGSSAPILVDLLLADNFLAELDPKVVEKLTSLQRLDLGSNKLRHLPYQLGFLSRVTTLELSGNPLTTKFRSAELNNPTMLLQTLRNRAPKDAVASSHDGAAKSAAPTLLMGALAKGNHTLDFVGKFTKENATTKMQLIVDELKASPSIAMGITGQLLLDSNQLQSLPNELLALLPNLTAISITRNALTELPKDSLSSYPQLKSIKLRRNVLTTASMEASFGSLIQSAPVRMPSVSSLTHLDLSANRIESFPANVPSAHFPLLEHMNLSSNRIQSVYDWKHLPKSLTFLDLSENSIEDMDPLVPLLASDCPNLQHFSVMHNSIKSIPASLGLLHQYCPKMASLNIRGNPQRGIPTHVQDYDCARLLCYLGNRLTPEQRAEAIRCVEARNATSEDIGVECVLVVEDKKEEQKEEAVDEKEAPLNEQEQDPPKESTSDLQRELQNNIADLETQLENLSLSQAKRYALKKSLAMERSKLIRENRRLQWEN